MGISKDTISLRSVFHADGRPQWLGALRYNYRCCRDKVRQPALGEQWRLAFQFRYEAEALDQPKLAAALTRQSARKKTRQ